MGQRDGRLRRVGRFRLHRVVLAVVVVPELLPVHSVAKHEVDAIDIDGNLDLKFELVDVAEVVRVTAVASVELARVHPTVERVLD